MSFPTSFGSHSCQIPGPLGAFASAFEAEKLKNICKTLFALLKGNKPLSRFKRAIGRNSSCSGGCIVSQEIITGCITHVLNSLLDLSLTSPYPCKYLISFHQILVISLFRVMFR